MNRLLALSLHGSNALFRGSYLDQCRRTSDLSTTGIKKRIEILRKLTAVNKDTLKDLDDNGLAAVANALKAEHRRRARKANMRPLNQTTAVK